MTTAAETSILVPGRNCWRVDQADRFFSIQDAAEYYRLARQAMLGAKHNVLLLGWDIHAGVDMTPGETDSQGPTKFAALVNFIGRRNRNRRVDILTWDYGTLYTLERDPFSRLRLGWRTPPNVRFRYDDHHPVAASHHQKIIVVDDQLAFCGGVDVTAHRWDTAQHNIDEPHRKSGYKHYGPYHEMQAMLSGPAAASLGELARDRWRAIGDTNMPPIAKPSADLWPADVVPDFTNVRVGISRTMPAMETEAGTSECEALFVDSIAAARELIYVESQYFTNSQLAEKIAARLKEPDGPEVIVVTPRKCEGWLERNTMGARRQHAFHLLLAADIHKRMRILCPMASQAQDVPTFVHSKVTVIDDRHFRIGSANFSRRSMGVDTECDVAVEAESDEHRQAVRRAFHRLLAEHLGLETEDVTRGIDAAGSLREFVDTRAGADRTLVRIEVDASEDGLPDIVQEVADPIEPVQPASLMALATAALRGETPRQAGRPRTRYRSGARFG
jgi:phospholipase D1/2